MSKLFVGLLISLWSTLSLAGSVAEELANKVIVPFAIADSGHLVIDVSFNGMPPSAMLIDTAAGLSLLDKKVARALGIEQSSSRSKIKLAGLGTKKQSMRDLDVVDIEIGMGVFPAPNFYTTDLHHIRRIKNNEPIVGILGTDFLFKHQGIVNYVDRTLTLSW